MVTGEMGAAHRRSFELSAADLLEVHRRIFWRNLRSWRVVLTFAVVSGLMLVASLVKKDGADLIGWAIWVAGFATLFPIAMTRFVMPRQTRAAIEREPRYREPWQIGFGPDALTVSNAQGVTQYYWSGFTARHAGSTMMALMTSPHSFVPIPLRALRKGDLQTIDARLKEAGVALR
ncbi:YcxB family protein [Methylobacterium sp. C25]|uniref:YcxB family protein n=1 Tax=Methylobacterium sp. C25 TaxID=2721622 RepID=UPI001F3E7760|nr:YcxB family protein [Methylobacterium sp. C25]MCE4225852.1 YcxB family protein [Methylobacterium sp. C25]